MDIEKIRNLIELMEEKELVTLEISENNSSVKLTRYYEPTPTMVATASNSSISNTEATATISKPKGATEDSPMVGVFYSAPSPNDPPFVTVGQKVKAGEQLGIIEAMKIMNPLEATQSGIIEEVLIKNGEVVEFGQPVIRYKS